MRRPSRKGVSVSVTKAMTAARTGEEELAEVLTPTDSLEVDEDGVLRIEGCSCLELLARFGSPLFVVSEQTLRANYRRLFDAYAKAWPEEINVMYAIKANNNLAIRAILHQEGAGGDVFGEGELYATFMGGADPDKLVLNGSNKSFELVQTAVRLGIRVNVDDEEEIDFLEQVVEQGTTPARANLRLNIVPPEFDPSGKTRDRQWGFSLEGAIPLVNRLLAINGLEFEGLHLHIGRTSADPAFHIAWARKLAEGIVELHRRTGFVPRLLDVGGGYARERDIEARAPYAFKPNTDSPTVYRNVHAIEEYAAAVSEALLGPLREAGLPTPRLWLEPGRYICGNAVVLLGSVGAVKRDAGRIWVNVDVSINNIPRAESHGYKYFILPGSKMRAPYEIEADVVGPLCTGVPLGEDRKLPLLRRGDAIAIPDAGMYAEVRSMQMNGVPRPATVLVNQGEAEIIKERETVLDVFAHHRIPERLMTRQSN
jgi:diaminopimelate decarboxylase